MNDIHPLIRHAPADVGNDSIPALRVLSEIPTSLSTDSNVEQLLGRFLSTMIRLAGAQAGAVRVITDDRTHLRLIGSVGLPPEPGEHENIVSVDCGGGGEGPRGGGAVRVITDDRTHLRLIGSVGLPPELVEHENIVSVDCGVCGKAAREVTVS